MMRLSRLRAALVARPSVRVVTASSLGTLGDTREGGVAEGSVMTGKGTFGPVRWT
jgi:hypothetical protein